MSETSTLERDPESADATPEEPAPTGGPGKVEVRRNALLAAVLGLSACALALAYVTRAATTSSPVYWAVAVALALVGVTWLVALVDARAPLLVADDQGLRIRFGRRWTGVPWSDLERVEHLPRRGLLRDGRLVPVPYDPDTVVADLDARGRRRSRFASRWYGGPLAVSLGSATRVAGAPSGLQATLADLAGAATPVVDTTPAPQERTKVSPDEESLLEVASEPSSGTDEPDATRRPGPRPAMAHGIGAIASLLGRRGDRTAVPVDDTSELVLGATALDPDADPSDRDELPEAEHLRRRPDDEGDGWVDEPFASAPATPPEEPETAEPVEVLETPVPLPVEAPPEPVIGPRLALARTRLQLTVDQLADRTRIRPHVIESIEGDDFTPCGGDFYARGHLRTLARILGVDAAPLVAAYDAHFAHEPIDARRVSEAELASGSIRGTRGGPNWSVLVAAVMALVLAWSIARLVMDAPIELRAPAPVLNGSGGLNNGATLGDPVPVVLRAQRGARVVVRDGTGEIAWTGDLAIGESKRLSVVYPIRVTSTDGGAVSVTVDGNDRGAVGEDDTPAESTYIAD